MLWHKDIVYRRVLPTLWQQFGQDPYMGVMASVHQFLPNIMYLHYLFHLIYCISLPISSLNACPVCSSFLMNTFEHFKDLIGGKVCDVMCVIKNRVVHWNAPRFTSRFLD